VRRRLPPSSAFLQQRPEVRDGEASFSPPTTPSIEFHSLDSLGEEALTYQGKAKTQEAEYFAF